MLNRCLKLEPNFSPAYLELARLRGPNDRSVGILLKRLVHLNGADPYYSTIYAHWLLDKGKNIVKVNLYYKE